MGLIGCGFWLVCFGVSWLFYWFGFDFVVGGGLGGVPFDEGLLFVIGADWVSRWFGFALLVVLFGFVVCMLIGLLVCFGCFSDELAVCWFFSDGLVGCWLV